MPEEENSQVNAQAPPSQPGVVITPGAATQPPVPQAPAAPEPPQPLPEEPVSDPADEPPSQPETVTWTATEFIAHDKSAGWYLGLALVAVIGVALVYLATKDVISVAVVVVAALVLGVYAGHKPRQLEYQIDQRGITIGNKRHGFGEFKSFAVIPEDSFSSIVFTPLKRFSPLTTIYITPEYEQKIITVLTGSLPYEEGRRDAVDGLMRRIRF